jgi:hypothetical protein
VHSVNLHCKQEAAPYLDVLSVISGSKGPASKGPADHVLAGSFLTLEPGFNGAPGRTVHV